MVRIVLRDIAAEKPLDRIQDFKEGFDVSYWEGFLCIKDSKNRVIAGYHNTIVDKFEISKDLVED